MLQREKIFGDALPRAATSALALLFPVLSLLVDRSDSIILGILLVLGVWAWIRYGFRQSLSRDELWLCAVVLTLFAIAVASYWFGVETDLGFRILGRYLRWLLFPFVLIAWIAWRPSTAAVWAGLVGGACVNGGYAIFEYCLQGSGQVVSGDTQHIVFGDCCLVLGFMSLAGYRNFLPRRPRVRGLILAAAFLLGVAGSLLSGSRGSWLAFPVLAVTLVVTLRGRARLLTVSFIALAALVAAAIALWGPKAPVESRVLAAWANTREYLAFAGRIQSLQDGNPCISSKPLLEGLARHAPRSANAALAVVAIHAPHGSYADISGCRLGYALSLSSTDGENAWAGLLRLGPQGGYASLLASGNGALVFWPNRDSRVRVSSPGLVRVQPGPDVIPNQYLSMEIFGRGNMKIIPVERVPGEYRFFYAYSSAGIRLEMWRAAWKIFDNHKVLGAGTGSWRVQAAGLTGDGEFMANIAHYDHPHNQYLAELALRGLVGLASLVFLFFLLFYLCRARDGQPAEASGFALALLLFLLGMATFFLTETMFVHTLVIDWFVFVTALFVAMIRPEPEER